jgi:hypothetical protein
MKKPAFTSDELGILMDGLVALVHETEKDLYDPSRDPSEAFVDQTEQYLHEARKLKWKLHDLRAELGDLNPLSFNIPGRVSINNIVWACEGSGIHWTMLGEIHQRLEEYYEDPNERDGYVPAEHAKSVVDEFLGEGSWDDDFGWVRGED